jgi:hypothetical protein
MKDIPIDNLVDGLEALIDPQGWAARKGAELGKHMATYDPCATCGHGKALHRALNGHGHRAGSLPSVDDGLPETACRVTGFYQNTRDHQTCDCQCWIKSEASCLPTKDSP